MEQKVYVIGIGPGAYEEMTSSCREGIKGVRCDYRLHGLCRIL